MTWRTSQVSQASPPGQQRLIRHTCPPSGSPRLFRQAGPGLGPPGDSQCKIRRAGPPGHHRRIKHAVPGPPLRRPAPHQASRSQSPGRQLAPDRQQLAPDQASGSSRSSSPDQARRSQSPLRRPAPEQASGSSPRPSAPDQTSRSPRQQPLPDQVRVPPGRGPSRGTLRRWTPSDLQIHARRLSVQTSTTVLTSSHRRT